MLLCFDGLGQTFPKPEELAWRLVLEANRRITDQTISALLWSPPLMLSPGKQDLWRQHWHLFFVM